MDIFHSDSPIFFVRRDQLAGASLEWASGTIVLLMVSASTPVRIPTANRENGRAAYARLRAFMEAGS